MSDQESTAVPSDRETSGIGLGDELNRDFYAHSPSQYLRTRITLLIAFGDARTPIHQAVSEGVRAWEMSAHSDAMPDDDETDGFAVVESLSIMYLAAEALLRLYFAHADGGSCPPLQLSSLTSYAKFKQQAEALLNEPPSIESLRPVFRGMLDAPPDVPEETWAEDAEVLQFLVHRAAELMARESNVYNATKHGLAVQPRKSAMRLGSEEASGGVIIDHHGSSIRFLSKQPGSDHGVQQWRETIQFAFPSINLAVASAFADEIDAIHTVAKGRLLAEEGSIPIHRRALLEHLRAVPFGSNYTGLLSMAMNRNFQVKISRER
ncbi:hypothetical protein [Agromyces sp. NPDC049794]|uniref:hypothetical protein n=1 Tax=unclassified Agromyces TaxID=2639701 RepID=UPI0033EFA883